MNKPHKHCEIIKAWADGKKVQFYSRSADRWEDAATPVFYEAYQYRIKPEALKYRLYLHQSWNGEIYVAIVNNRTNQFAEEQKSFIKWLGDWQEVEM